VVSAVFELEPRHAERIAELAGIEPEDHRVILRRRLTGSGRSQAWINDQPVAVATLRAVGRRLVDVRVQHEHLRLADVGHQLACLDRYGAHHGLAESYAASHQRCLDLAAELEELQQGDGDSRRELDYLRFLIREIDDLDPQPGELEELEARQRLLASAAEWQALAGEAATALIEDDEGVVAVLARLASRLAEAPDSHLAEAGEACRQALECAREAGLTCAEASERLEADPGELARVDQRLAAWQDLLRKHGSDEQAVWDAREHSRQRVDELEHLDQRRQQVAEALEAERTQRLALGRDLAVRRREAFEALAVEVHRELAELGMPKARLSLHEAVAARPGPLGSHDQWLLVCTNPGLSTGPIGELASGGESARLTLALAMALAAADDVPVLVFDEVDAGVGGRLGAVMGRKLRALAAERSVIAVTHTPQLAAAAHRNYLVAKDQGDDHTAVRIDELAGEHLVSELADMLGGGNAAREQATALLGEGRSSV